MISLLDMLEMAGPRALSDLIPEDVRKEACATPRFRAYRIANEATARLRHLAMLKQQELIGRDNHNSEFKNVDGLGTLYMRVSQKEYLAMRAIYGDECWNDPEFVEAYRRDNPYCRPKITRDTKGNEIRR